MEYKSERGKAIVIVGPQGSGKTSLARQIAGRAGCFVETTSDRFSDHFGLSRMLRNEPKTVIVDGMPSNDTISPETLLWSDTIVAARQGAAPASYATPFFIFCVESFTLPADSRRFTVIKL